MYALVDVNNFYTSCETLFRPDLKGKAVCVVSNNDGCVISRSAASKKLGIKMGQPWFELKKQPFPEPIYFFSSNYEFYGSMSARVSTVLDKLAPQCEIYSIDESFLFINGMDNIMSWEDYGRMVRKSVFAHTGLTVGIGIGPTKTLAKAAQYSSKKWPQFGGVVALSADNRPRIEKMLSLIPVEEVWGCGRRITKKLEIMGIKTALDLSRADLNFIRRNFSVVLERTVRELQGDACIALEEHPPAKQQIVCSRSFGARVETLDDMRQAVCRYAVRAAAKLRGERQFCRHISVFIKTSPFSVNEPYYGNISSEKLLLPTQDTREIVAAAAKCLKRIWLDGHRYAKAGVMLNDFTDGHHDQLTLFDDCPPRPHSEALMKVVDGINHSRLGKLFFAGEGINPGWQMKREMLSPAYTTRWADIPVANIR